MTTGGSAPLLSGGLDFRPGEIREEMRIVGAGEAGMIPSVVPHEAIGVEGFLAPETFALPRRIRIDGTDACLGNVERLRVACGKMTKHPTTAGKHKLDSTGHREGGGLSG